MMTLKRAWRRLLYRLYLRLPWWQRARRQALERAGGRCQLCGASAQGRHRELHVHHRRYREGGRSVLWREQAGDLQVLCRRCHASAHARSSVRAPEYRRQARRPA